MSKTIFIKPLIDQCCTIFCEHEIKVRIINIVLSKKIDLDNLTPLVKEFNPDVIRFDGSIFVQEGKILREQLENPVIIYKSKGKLDERAVSQQDWIKENVIYRRDYKDFHDIMNFISLLTDYKIGENENNIAIDILSDIAKYYRNQNKK